MLDVYIHQYVHTKYIDDTADSSKLLKNHFVNELDLTSFKFAAIKWIFQKFRRIGKVLSENIVWTY